MNRPRTDAVRRVPIVLAELRGATLVTVDQKLAAATPNAALLA
jgi:predicted nucleic acid-binding protein